MRRVALIYNPASGRGSDDRIAEVAGALEVLRRAGVEAEAVATVGPGSAAGQAREAILRGCDAILACGGDGTVNEVLQSVAGGTAALGVLPLGTANALAADLGLPHSPEAAAAMLLTASRVRVPVGRIGYCDLAGVPRSRYFTVAAGIGADALLISRLDAKLKRRFGYALYAIEGLRILALHSFPLFEAGFCLSEDERRAEYVSQLMAVRIRDFGGVLHKLAPGASLRHETLRLVAVKTRRRWDYLRFLLAMIGQRHRFSERIELMDAQSVECRAGRNAKEPVYVEADGELLGTLPARIEIVPRALTLLIPGRAEG
jgi:YegS/Rv2252/BmrU family lipid kinase